MSAGGHQREHSSPSLTGVCSLFVGMLVSEHSCSYMENSSLCTDIHELNLAYAITNFNF